MNADLCRLIEKLDLDPEDINEYLKPFVLGDSIASGGTSIIFDCFYPSSPDGYIVKLPRVPEEKEYFNINWDMCLYALEYEANILSAVDGIHGVISLTADRRNLLLPHLVMPKLGRSLDSLLDEKGLLTLKECSILLADVSSTLHNIHKLNIVHGDISPHNLLMSTNGTWVLIDPSPPGICTFEEIRLRGADLDVMCLGRTFLFAYYGIINYTDFPADEIAEIEEYPELFRLVKQMLGKTRYPIPSAKVVSIKARNIFLDYFATID